MRKLKFRKAKPLAPRLASQEALGRDLDPLGDKPWGGMDGMKGVPLVGTVRMGTNAGVGGGKQHKRARAPTLMVFVCSLRPLRVLMALSASLGSE